MEKAYICDMGQELYKKVYEKERAYYEALGNSTPLKRKVNLLRW